MPGIESAYRCGYVAVVGRPNVGKSTLINRLLDIKLSITSKRPQTTRDRILGIKTRQDAQIILLDTPGIHNNGERALNRHMNRVAIGALEGVDLVIFVSEALKWGESDKQIMSHFRQDGPPVVLVVNKVDLLADKQRLFPILENRNNAYPFAAIIPISARRARDVKHLEESIIEYLPLRAAEFDEDEYTDRSVRFLCCETIREKLIRQLGQEVPHRLAVELTQFKHDEHGYQLEAILWVESKGQKTIVIGAKGAVLKLAGTEARRAMERLLDKKVHLGLWVKVRGGWSNDEKFISTLGYRD